MRSVGVDEGDKGSWTWEDVLQTLSLLKVDPGSPTRAVDERPPSGRGRREPTLESMRSARGGDTAHIDVVDRYDSPGTGLKLLRSVH